MKKNQKILILFSMIFLGGFSLFSKFISNVNSQGAETPTTANVTVQGCLDEIIVTYDPVNFTSGSGRIPGGTPVSKTNLPDYIMINMSKNTNVNWDIYINASHLTSLAGIGAPINPDRLTVWSSCNGGTQGALPASLNSNGDLIKICSDMPYYWHVNVTFNLTIPVGQSNDTYYGDIWIYVNSSYNPAVECSNKTWHGTGTTTVKVTTNVEFNWDSNTVPITFQTLSPGTGFFGVPSANATINKGFPANMSIQKNTNIFTDLYIKGNDLKGLTGAAQAYTILVGLTGNLTYSNATTNVTQPGAWPSFIKFVNYTFQEPYLGDFLNWHGVKNDTNVTSFWNISIPSSALPGSYGGDIFAKAVDQGRDPNTP